MYIQQQALMQPQDMLHISRKARMHESTRVRILYPSPYGQ